MTEAKQCTSCGSLRPMSERRCRGAGAQGFYCHGSLIEVWIKPKAEPPASETRLVYISHGAPPNGEWFVVSPSPGHPDASLEQRMLSQVEGLVRCGRRVFVIDTENDQFAEYHLGEPA